LLASAAYGFDTDCENVRRQSSSKKPIRLTGGVRVLGHSGVLLVHHCCNLSYRLAWNTELSFERGGTLQDKKFKAFEKYVSSENKLDGKVIHMNYHEFEID